MAEFNLRVQKYHDGTVLGLRLYMLKYWMSYQNRRFWESYWPAFVRSKDKKMLLHTMLDLFRLTWTWQCLPYHYFRYGLYEKRFSYRDMLTYLPETVFFYEILPQINKQTFLLDDKNVFESMIKGYGIPHPKTVFKTLKKTPYGSEMDVVVNKDYFSSVLKKTNADILFCKPADCGSGGKGIFILKRKNNMFVDEEGNQFSFDYLVKMSGSDWIIQEAVENCQVLKNIYEYATNSFRVLTYFKPSEGAKVMYCILKLGNNKAYTDNAHTGGIYVKIDTKTGNLADTAYDENLYSYKAHPLTGVKFKDKKIANIGQVVSLAEKLGNICPSMTFVGWDIALTPEGPVVLEGNSSPGLTIIQRTYGGMQEFIKLVQAAGVLK